MGRRLGRKNHVCCMQPLTPLIEGPNPEDQGDAYKKESSLNAIRAWVRLRTEKRTLGSHSIDLKLVLGVLGCPLAPIPLPAEQSFSSSIKDSPIETRSAGYIVQQYLAATGCLKLQKEMKSVYVSGSVRMTCTDMESGYGKLVRNGGGGVDGCFVIWQMSPGMWQMELVAAGCKIVAGSNGNVVWRHLPWLGMNAARGPQRPLRRIIQGLDPRSTAKMFAKAQCIGEKKTGDEDCFVLKVSADREDRETVTERSDGPAEVIRHVLYGYFSHKSGLLVYIEDSHLTRVQTPGTGAVYWETTLGSRIEEYKDVEGVLVAHRGRSVATLFRFGEASESQSRTRMEEEWRIDDVAFNVPGLSVDCFIPPVEILNVPNGSDGCAELYSN